jgi:2-polyprenyl-3-methyl-5-hydroxy-6-metoxy-1,4-benzoquinol methylase
MTSAQNRFGFVNLQEEQAFLNKVYATYTVDHSSQTRVMRELVFRTIEPFLIKGHGLELGCSDGYMTELLAARLDHLDVVDGSSSFLEVARKRNISNVTYNLALFEEYESVNKYDYVFASFILEHVLDPLLVLRMIRLVLKPGGLVFLTVPNARALSRQMAMHMNLIDDLKALTQNDLMHGHRRVYDRVSFNSDLRQAGLKTVMECGLMLKILADFQMDKLIDNGVLQDKQIDGLYKLGLEYPDLCGALFSVCRVDEIAKK